MLYIYKPSSTVAMSSKYFLRSTDSILIAFERSQFCAHTSVSTVVGANVERNGLITLPLVLNADSEATLDIRIAKISLAI